MKKRTEKKERLSCGNTECNCNHMGFCIRNEQNQKQNCHFDRISVNF